MRTFTTPKLATPSAPAQNGTNAGTGTFVPSAEAAQEAVYDKELVKRFREGEEHVFMEIMERYSARIFGLANNLLRNASDAEEITQDTFIRAHRNLRDFRGDSSLATWLYRIALNLSRNRYWYFFRRKRQESISLEHEVADGDGSTGTMFGDMIAADSRTPVQETVTEEFSKMISECMERLDAPHREILTMRNVLNLSYDEIAEALGLNVGTVKSRIARARESLRKMLAEIAPEFKADLEPSAFFEHARPAPGCFAIAYA